MVFFFPPPAEVMVDISKMLADLLRAITSAWFTLLFHSYLATYLQLPPRKTIHTATMNADFHSQRQQTETALSEILESISVQ